MTTPFEDARRHALVGSRHQGWLRDLDVLNNFREPGTGYTLLAVAVVAGFVDQVELLLGRRQRHGPVREPRDTAPPGDVETRV
jgi:hypothetical protein